MDITPTTKIAACLILATASTSVSQIPVLRVRGSNLDLLA
jgi:hypothetical protein